MSERAARRFRIAMGKRGEDLPPPRVCDPPTEVTRPAFQRARRVSSSRLCHALRPFPALGAASLVKDGGNALALSRTLCSRAVFSSTSPVTKATRTRVPALHVLAATHPVTPWRSSATQLSGINPQISRAGFSRTYADRQHFSRGLAPSLNDRSHRRTVPCHRWSRPSSARGSQPAHTRPRLRRWRPRDTGCDAPRTRGAISSAIGSGQRRRETQNVR
jgi:hypothetical protein